jgi:hypothetical protein
VERNENASEEDFVLFLQRQRKSVDNGPQNLKQLRYPVVAFRLIDELEKDVVDGSTDKGTEVEELSIDTVEGGLEEVPLPRVLRIEKFQEVQNEGLVDVSLGQVGVEVWALNEPKEEFVDDLQVGPC